MERGRASRFSEDRRTRPDGQLTRDWVEKPAAGRAKENTREQDTMIEKRHGEVP